MWIVETAAFKVFRNKKKIILFKETFHQKFYLFLFLFYTIMAAAEVKTFAAFKCNISSQLCYPKCFLKPLKPDMTFPAVNLVNCLFPHHRLCIRDFNSESHNFLFQFQEN